ncbi:DUF2911 domain-containing protein [Mucilaginibacter sp.]|uniref:DUF2911 domain-containing protein n=1 Tax=Mucilaginibacter sp. TaxID=1882438 RepID=UPI002610444C|nr:DUF2911 domain-containing protein [Mucilaginibacter sp.]MDB4927290.1 hypothetical protein [Mucilaginibacter sp.]
MKRIIICLIICLFASGLKAQIPDFSSTQHIDQEFGLGTISLTYGRPNVKGRKIFNGTEPYGVVWRTGANAATTIKFTDTVSVEGHKLMPGEYSLFTIPGATEWIVIFNKIAKQWGAYSYDQKQDVLRFKVKPFKLAAPVETLTIQFANVNIDKGILQILWENTGLSLHLKTDVDARVIANIAQMMKGEKKPYYLAAIWYYNHNLDMHKALEWMNEVEKVQPDAYNVRYWKAKIQLKLGDKKGAIFSAKIGLAIAEKDKNAEYIRMNKEILREAGAIK